MINNNYLCHGKRLDNGVWVEGYPLEVASGYPYILNGVVESNEEYIAIEDWRPVNPATLSRCTGLKDKNGRLIFEGDVTELALPCGEVRRFEVIIKTVIREVVSHPDFDTATAKVAITGVVFLWCGYELFPCVDGNGENDASRMIVIGNIHDNPELLGEVDT